MSFSKSGQLLFAGYDDYCCRGWAVTCPSEAPELQLYGHENRISSVSVSRDGRALCTASWDSTIKVSNICLFKISINCFLLSCSMPQLWG